MIEQQVDITTKDGATTTFIVHPERDGPHPVILFYMDAPAIREELRDMARRFASAGYYVMLPNLYYRAGVMELGPLSPDPNDPSRQKMMDLMYGLTIAMVMDDTDSLVAYADLDPAADAKRIGTVGYCMSGQHAINAAARHSARVKAAASIYGTYLVTDKADSPHLAARKSKAELYFACAEIDRWAPLEMVEELGQSLDSDPDVRAEVELYPGVEHGFAFPQRGAYDKTAAERHWERLNALFRRNLG
ncbi:dienelactone hydrolase family protein [Phenylobacterium aquaticum]|uniref:dienelactone hydrolase family protein n=1 Tax=Phenylobacterium aquaticum TaxID=1763816 RepID=UPI0026EA25E7|nr:dienelactone hydrolase family protein [Phenylobacterium aquaticum]